MTTSPSAPESEDHANRYISRLPDPAGKRTGPRRLAILGSTGSIGRSALAVIADSPGEFEVLGLAAGRNVRLLAEQASCLRPPVLAVIDAASADALRALLPADYRPEILHGPEGYIRLASLPEAETVLSAQVGAAGLPATLAAARCGKLIALANKESLVMAGHLIRRICAETGAIILPVDSEHNAIFQALHGHDPATLRRLILTASGGPFRHKSPDFLTDVTPAQAVNHPNWSMGAKISVDSATLMNKGLEVIEAYHLYGVGLERIEVVVHPQSIIHSLVEYADGSNLAHLGVPDMRIPIAYCLAYPRRLPLPLRPLDLVECGTLSFERPRTEVFPCLNLARQAAAAGPGHQTALNASNEVAVALFLDGRIGFTDIPVVIAGCLEARAWPAADDLESIMDLDRSAREIAAGLASRRSASPKS